MKEALNAKLTEIENSTIFTDLEKNFLKTVVDEFAFNLSQENPDKYTVCYEILLFVYGTTKDLQKRLFIQNLKEWLFDYAGSQLQ